MNTREQFVKNFLINGLNFLTSIMLGLIMTPFLVKNLGISTFGIVQIGISVSALFAILSTSLNQSNNKFVSLSIVNADSTELSSTLTTIFILYFASFIIVTPFLLIVSIYPHLFFDFDVRNGMDISFMFLFLGIAQFFVMLTTAFMSPAYANNRLDIIQSISILRNVLRLSLVIILISFYSNSAFSVGLSFLLSSFVAVSVAYVVFSKFVPGFSLKVATFSLQKAKDVIHLSGWTVVNSIGMILFLQADVVLLNVFVGSDVAGKYAILVQWSMLLIAVTAVLSVVLSPIILNYYAHNNLDKLKCFFYKSIRYQGIYTMISVTLVFVYSDTILLVWIGDEYTYLSVYMQAMVFHLGVTQSVRQISTMNTAYNKMKTSGLVTVLFGCFHICASIILLKYTSFTLLAVILSNLFFSILLNIIFLPLFVSNYLKESVTRIYKNIYPILLTQIIVLISSYSTKYLILPNDAFSLAFSIALSFTAALVLVYLLILTEQERHFVMAYYRRFLN